MTQELSKNIKEASKLTNEEWKEWTKTVWSIANTSDPNHPAVFPLEIPYRLIRMFSFLGETVLDPFSGMATTGKAAIKSGRKYVGFEVNSEYLELSRNRINDFANEEKITINDGIVDLRNQSCMNMDSIPDDSVGIVVTSPPYWNKADYGNYEDNIGRFEYYDDFLDCLDKVIKNCYRVL